MYLLPQHTGRFTLASTLVLAGVFVFAFPSKTRGAQQNSITLSITLSNTYTGSVSLTSPLCLLSGQYYVGNSGTIIRIASTATSDFTLSGTNASIATGTVTGNSFVDAPITFLTGHTGQNVSALLMRGTEPLFTNTLALSIDDTPPTSLIAARPLTFRNDTVRFSRSGATDALPLHYRLIIADEPTFSTPLIYPTIATNMLLSKVHFPVDAHIIYWYVEVIDCAGNTTMSTPSFFYYVTERSGGFDEPPSDDDDHTAADTPSDTTYDTDQESGTTQNPLDPDQPLPEVLQDTPRINWVSGRLPSVHIVPPKYASKVFPTLPQLQVQKLLARLQDNAYPLDYFPEKYDFETQSVSPRNQHYFDPINHLILLIRYAPARFDKAALYTMVEYIIHIRYIGLFLIISIIGYDVDWGRRRLLYCDKLIKRDIKIGHLRKKYIK